jgi:hypothetical protein
VTRAPEIPEPFASDTLPFSVEFETSAWPKIEEGRSVRNSKSTSDAGIKRDRETVVIQDASSRKNMRKKHLIILAVGRFCEVSAKPPKAKAESPTDITYVFAG